VKLLFLNSSDNLLFVLTNFIFQIYFARVLSYDDFGSMNIIYTIYIFIQMIMMSFYHEIFVVESRIHTIDDTISLFLGILKHIIFITSVMCITIAIAMLAIFSYLSLFDYIIISISILLLVSFQFSRRIFHFTNSHKEGTLSSMLFLLSFMIILFICLYIDLIFTPSISFLILGLSTVPSLIFIIYYTNKFNNKKNIYELSGIIFIKRGLVVFVSNLSYWISSNIYVFLIPIIGTIAMLGEFRILLLLVLPFNHIIASLNTIILTKIKIYYENKKNNLSRRLVYLWIVFICISGTIYGSIVFFFFNDLLLYIFDKSIILLPIEIFLLSIIPMLSVMNLPSNMYLRVIKEQKLVAKSAIISLIMLIISILILSIVDNFTSITIIFISYVVFYFISAILSFIFFYTRINHE
jgi:O-antigen/teichoic acid export membrane protein